MIQMSSTDHSHPLADLNTTPLIDVLLVLLVMFIITVPLQTHAVKIDLPVPCPRCLAPDSKLNIVTIGADGQLAWNSAPVSMDEFRAMLGRTQAMDPEPELHLQPDASARYAAVDEVLAEIKRARVQKFGFVGNETHRDIF